MKPIFVFGSNMAGKHLGGAARFALVNNDAVFGQGEGLQGTSYALPTMDENLQPLPLAEVEKAVKRFLAFATDRTDLTFQVTAVGCGIAGFSREDIIPMFRLAPLNCFFFEAAFGQVVTP